MNLMSGGFQDTNIVSIDRDRQPRLPVVRCPVCNHRGHTRTSEELSPETRRLYYRCSNFKCGMTWQAILSFEKVVSPSGISPTFRPAHFKERKPPGHDYGQLSILDMLTVASP